LPNTCFKSGGGGGHFFSKLHNAPLKVLGCLSMGGSEIFLVGGKIEPFFRKKAFGVGKKRANFENS